VQGLQGTGSLSEFYEVTSHVYYMVAFYGAVSSESSIYQFNISVNVMNWYT